MAGQLMNQDEAASALVTHMFSGVVGPAEGKEVSYSLLKATEDTFSWIAALEDEESAGCPIDRYHVDIDRRSRQIRSSTLISPSRAELADAVLAATGHHLKAWFRLGDAALGISYRIEVVEDPSLHYVLQLRHRGNVTSMSLLMRLISATIDHAVLPLPDAYLIPGEDMRQKATGMGRQLTRLVPGLNASSIYWRMSHDERLAFVRRMALAYQACWELPLPKNRLIGELYAAKAGDSIELNVGPDRHYSLGGPFSSVRDYLRAHIRSALKAFERQEDIDGYKAVYLERVRTFVEGGMHNIPIVVEDVPVVAIHSDMGPHNIILSPYDQTKPAAIINWECTVSAPYPSTHRSVEMLFRRLALSGFGVEYEQADHLRQAFWDMIPKWKKWEESEATAIFLEWFRFAIFMKAERRQDDLDEVEKELFWAENVRIVAGMLRKYAQQKPTSK